MSHFENRSELSEMEQNRSELSEMEQNRSELSEIEQNRSEMENRSQIENTILSTNENCTALSRPRQDFSHLWVVCDFCDGMTYHKIAKEKRYICEFCDSYIKMTSSQRIDFLLDSDTWKPMDQQMRSLDPIHFDSLDPLHFDSNDEPEDPSEFDSLDEPQDLLLRDSNDESEGSSDSDSNDESEESSDSDSNDESEESSDSDSNDESEESSDSDSNDESEESSDSDSNDESEESSDSDSNDESEESSDSDSNDESEESSDSDSNDESEESSDSDSNDESEESSDSDSNDESEESSDSDSNDESEESSDSDSDDESEESSDSDSDDESEESSDSDSDDESEESSDSDSDDESEESSDSDSDDESEDTIDFDSLDPLEDPCDEESDSEAAAEAAYYRDLGICIYVDKEKVPFHKASDSEDEGEWEPVVVKSEDEGEWEPVVVKSDDEGEEEPTVVDPDDDEIEVGVLVEGDIEEEKRKRRELLLFLRELFPKEEEEEEVDIEDDEPYIAKMKRNERETGLAEAVETGTGELNGIKIAMGVMDFRFVGGSMGSVVGEKITRLIEHATKEFLPLIIVCASGGARMQEGSLSLMQMAKISSTLYKYRDAKNKSNQKLFYIPLLTTPTTGGVTASFAMLGDIIIAEPDAYIAFAGKRVIEELFNIEVPEGSQEAEVLFEKGFLDLIVPRNLLKSVVTELFQFHSFCFDPTLLSPKWIRRLFQNFVQK